MAGCAVDRAAPVVAATGYVEGVVLESCRSVAFAGSPLVVVG